MVVVGIVAVLVAIIIAALGSAKDNALDKAILGNMLTIRNQAQLYFDGPGSSSYAPDELSPYTNDCTRGLYLDPVVTQAVNRIKIDRGIDYVACFSSTKTFAIVAKLKSGNNYFCLDSMNSGKIIDGNSNAAWLGMYGQGSQNGDPSVKTGVVDTNTALCNSL